MFWLVCLAVILVYLVVACQLAPPITARQAPNGIKLDDGYQSLVAFMADPDVAIWEISVKPPGLDGGEEVDTTTMHNTVYRTSHPRALKTLTPSTIKGAYDPGLYLSLLSLINVETAITVHFPNGDTLSFWGFLKNFEPDELQEGTFPTASFTFVPTNQDPNTGAEEGPVLVQVGTGTGTP